MKDRLPPFDAESEMAVIGCCVTTPQTSIAEAGMVITSPDYFYDHRCRQIWETVSKMDAKDVNLITVAGQIESKANKTQTFAFLNQCQDMAPSSANLPAWLEVVQSKYTLRKIIATATNAVQAAYESDDTNQTLDAFESAVLKIRPQKMDQKDIRTLVREAIEVIEYRAKNWDAVTGLETGMPDLDRLTDGLHPGELIIIAALPSCGKTALAVNIAIHNALKGIPVGILSAEMRPVQLVIRSICSEARVNFKRIDDSDCVKIVNKVGSMAAAPLYIQQANGWTIGQAQACARRWSQQYGIKLLVADYIQRFQGIGDKRELQIASIGAGFKNMALELGIPVIAPSQLNDEGQLRESRALGQDADSVWKLQNDGAWRHDTQPINLKVEKCRDGETGEIKLTFQKIWTRFESQQREQIESYD